MKKRGGIRIRLFIIHTLTLSLIIAAVLMGTAMGEVSRAGLVGEWHFDGDARDSSGNGKDGTINGEAIFVNGKLTKALNFDGVDDNVSLGNWFNYQTFTISMWVNANPSQGQYADIIDNQHHFNVNWVMQQDNFSQNQYGFASGDFSYQGFSFSLNPNQWTHLVITRNANTKKNWMYINGVSLTSYNSPYNSKEDINYDGNQFIRLGSWGLGGRYWGGKIDELIIYNRDLSAEEAKANYEAGQVTVTSTVTGVEVFLDGISKGTATPTLAVYGVSPGAHTVKCKLSGYLDYETNINLPASSTVSATCSLSQPGSISVTSSPSGAEIYLEGALKGTAPVLLKDINPGKHVIWCKKSGFEDFQQNIEVTPGGIITITCTMVQANATPISSPTQIVTYRTTPALVTPTTSNISQQSGATPTPTSTLTLRSASIMGKITDAETGEMVQSATVNIDGKSILTGDDGEYELEVDAGKHNLSVSKEGYGKVTRTIIISETGMMLDISLKSISESSSWVWIGIILLIILILVGVFYFFRKKKKGTLIKDEKEKLCKFCKAPLPAGSKFCKECGTKQEEKTRFCMNCGSSMPNAPDLCPKCGKLPPSDVDTKTCKNCEEVIPKVAKFCSACGAGQPE